MALILAQFFRSRLASLACLAVVVLSLVLPPKIGFGIPMCLFKEVTHYPCLGCGLTRSFIDMAHLHIARAGFYHPLGLVLFPFTILIAFLLPVPSALRERLARWAETHRPALNGLGALLLGAFVVNGIGRIVWLVATHRPSPW